MTILGLSDFSGSLKDRANRLWTAKTGSRADLPLNLFATSFKGKKLTIVFFFFDFCGNFGVEQEAYQVLLGFEVLGPAGVHSSMYC